MTLTAFISRKMGTAFSFRSSPRSRSSRIILNTTPSGAVMTQIRFIKEFYDQEAGNLDREYLYLSVGEMDDFLENVIEYITAKLAAWL